MNFTGIRLVLLLMGLGTITATVLNIRNSEGLWSLVSASLAVACLWLYVETIISDLRR